MFGLFKNSLHYTKVARLLKFELRVDLETLRKCTAHELVEFCAESRERGDTVETTTVSWLVALMEEGMAYRRLLHDGSHFVFSPNDLERFHGYVLGWWMTGRIGPDVAGCFWLNCKQVLAAQDDQGSFLGQMSSLVEEDPSLKFYENGH